MKCDKGMVSEPFLTSNWSGFFYSLYVGSASIRHVAAIGVTSAEKLIAMQTTTKDTIADRREH